MAHSGITQVDISLFTLINQEWISPWLDPAMEMFSFVPLLWGIMAVAAILVVRRCWQASTMAAQRKERLKKICAGCLLIACSAGVTETVTWSVKRCVDKGRPYHELAGTRYIHKGEWVRRPVDVPPRGSGGTSFISGHSSNTMALANSLAFLYPPLKPFAYALPLCVGYSRVYLGKHYPSDVVAGWIVGWALSSLVCSLLGNRVACLRKKRSRRMSVALADIW